MKLYYMPGACSMAPHIVAAEAGLPLTCIKVKRDPAGNTVDGEDFRKINPLGLVPTLITDDGRTITETAVIIQYLASLAGGRLGDVTGPGRWKLQEVINFLATEIHKGFVPLFNPALDDKARAAFTQRLHARLSRAEEMVAATGWLVGDSFTIADAYLFTLLGWTRFLKMDLAPWPGLLKYVEKIAARPAVQAAMKEEGLA